MIATAIRLVIPAAAVVLLPVASQAQQHQEAREEKAQTTAEKNEKKKKDVQAEVRGFRWEDHPTYYFDRNTRIEFRARLQGAAHESEAPQGDRAAFDIARRRIGVSGRVAGLVDFQVEGEIDNDDPWRDVFVDYRQFGSLQVQAGKFKLPFSLDENTSATSLDFVYRSRAATQLAPGRDRGMMLHGRVLKRIIEYEVGVFDRDGRNARSRDTDRVSGGRTVAGRVLAQPFRSAKSLLSDLQVGIALTDSEVPEGFTALRGRTALDSAFFVPNYWVQGTRRRTGVELRWRPGPFSLKGEYISVTTERRGQSVENTDLSDLVAVGWYVSGSWAVTGERKSAGVETPRRSILHGGPGSIEFAARVERLRFGSAATGEPPSTSPRADVIAGNSDRAVTLGLNWCPLRGVKLQANVIRERIENPGAGPLPTRPGFWSRVFRVQFTL